LGFSRYRGAGATQRRGQKVVPLEWGGNHDAHPSFTRGVAICCRPHLRLRHVSRRPASSPASSAPQPAPAAAKPLLVQALGDLARPPRCASRCSIARQAPGSPRHRHPGHHTFGYVIEGTYEFANRRAGPHEILNAGRDLLRAADRAPLHLTQPKARNISARKSSSSMVADPKKHEHGSRSERVTLNDRAESDSPARSFSRAEPARPAAPAWPLFGPKSILISNKYLRLAARRPDAPHPSVLKFL